jgi:hypothetical protein
LLKDHATAQLHCIFICIGGECEPGFGSCYVESATVEAIEYCAANDSQCPGDFASHGRPRLPLRLVFWHGTCLPPVP